MIAMAVPVRSGRSASKLWPVWVSAAVCLLLPHASAQSVGPQIAKMVLAELNTLRDSLINPGVDSLIPEPIKVDTTASGSTSTCIIPSPFGCVCHASAGYSATLEQASGVNGTTVTNFTSVDAAAINTWSYNVSIVADLVTKQPPGSRGIHLTGKARASCSACGISPSADGTASTYAEATAVLEATATGVYNATGNCVRLVLNAAVVHLQPVSLHDTQVDISLGPIPGINVGSIVDKIIDMVPDITKAISGAIKGPITHALADVLPKLGCIKL